MGLFRAFGFSDQGPVRTSNEDCFGFDEQAGLCVVADGMGGHNGGEVASKLAVDGVTDFIKTSKATATWPFGFDGSLSLPANFLRLGNEHVPPRERRHASRCSCCKLREEPAAGANAVRTGQNMGNAVNHVEAPPLPGARAE